MRMVRVDVHLDSHCTLCFDEGQEGQAAVQTRAGAKLTEWFQANKKSRREPFYDM